MHRVSDELKTKILDVLSQQQQPLRLWDIAREVGYSAAQTGTALRWMVQEKSIECIKPSNAWGFNSHQFTTSTGFPTNRLRRSYLYRLPAEKSGGEELS